MPWFSTLVGFPPPSGNGLIIRVNKICACKYGNTSTQCMYV